MIADAAKAEILVRLVGDPAPIREAFQRRGDGRTREAEGNSVHSGDAISNVDGLPTTVVSFTTDVPMFGNELGRAAAARAGKHSRGAHDGGADSQARFGGSGGDLCATW